MNTTQLLKTLPFYKENGIWYADIPDFLERGLGTKANLMMVNGADSFLDLISGYTGRITLKISTNPLPIQDGILEKEGIGLDLDLLKQVGHAPVTYGAYYNVKQLKGKIHEHRLWLCPVTEYVFGGEYPGNIYFRII